MVIAFDNIFLQDIQKQILNESAHKPLPQKCYIEDIISLWHSSRDVLKKLIEQANRHHPIIKFTAEICRDETFLDTKIYKGQRFYKDSDLYMRTHFKPMETFQCKFLTLCHPPGVKKALVKGEALSHCLEQTLQSKHLKKTLQYFKNTLWREAIQSQQRTKDTRPPPTKRNKKTTLALHNTITPSS